MSEQAHSGWSVNEREFLRWLGDRATILEPAIGAKPTLKAMIFLSLLDANTPLTYGDIADAIAQHRAVTGMIRPDSLRVALSDLAKALDDSNHPRQLRSAVRGGGKKGSRFELVSRPPSRVTPPPPLPALLLMDRAVLRAEDIALSLVRDRRLPFYALYFLPRAACHWVSFSWKESELRKEYEGSSWRTLELDRMCGEADTDVICVLGLAVGEGLGEIELLRHILDDTAKRVHYLAVDLSPVLLTAHFHNVRSRFATELQDGRLCCAATVGNIFTDLEAALTDVRAEFRRRGSTAGSIEFFPGGSPLVATYFGNCLGNDAPDREWSVLAATSRVFQGKHPLAVVVGVSIKGDKPDKYERNWDDFLLQTPHHLLANLHLLDSTGNPAEFDPAPQLSEAEAKKVHERRCPDVTPQPYTAGPSFEIRGTVYRFQYVLDFDLEAKNYGLRVPARTKLLLYSIVKYDAQSLAGFIESNAVRCKLASEPKKIETPNGDRWYQVVAAYFQK